MGRAPSFFRGDKKQRDREVKKLAECDKWFQYWLSPENYFGLPQKIAKSCKSVHDFDARIAPHAREKFHKNMLERGGSPEEVIILERKLEFFLQKTREELLEEHEIFKEIVDPFLVNDAHAPLKKILVDMEGRLRGSQRLTRQEFRSIKINAVRGILGIFDAYIQNKNPIPEQILQKARESIEAHVLTKIGEKLRSMGIDTE